MKRPIFLGLLVLFIVGFGFAIALTARSQTVAFPIDGGTGISSATAGEVGYCLKVLDDSPFLYEFAACSSGGAGGVATTSLLAGYPVEVTKTAASITYSLAFGTTTSNTWANTQTFTNSPVFSTLGEGTVNSTAAGTVYNTATSTATIGNGLSYSGTWGQSIAGVSGTLTATLGTTIAPAELVGTPGANLILYTNGAGTGFAGAASSSIFGFTPLNPTRQLTVAGTANQITSSAGAQDLSADRTWTLSLPAHVIFPGNFQVTNATTTNATTTGAQYFTGVTASRPLYVDSAGKLGSAGSGTSGNCVNWGANNTFGDAGTACGSGGFAWPWTSVNAYGAQNWSTTSPMQFQGAINASSTIRLKTNLLSANAIGFLDFQRDAQATGDGYTLLRIKAPNTSPEEATLSLLNDFDGNNAGTNERFVDFYSEHYADSEQSGIRIFQTGTATLPNSFVFGWKLEPLSKDSQNVGSFFPNGGWLFGGPATTTQTIATVVTISSTTATNLIDAKAGTGVSRFLVLGTGNIGIGTTSPYAKLSVHAFNGQTNTTLFAIGSSTVSATTTLFSVSNTGTLTTTLGTGAVTSNSSGVLSSGTLGVANGGTGVSTFTSSQLLYGNGTAALSSVGTTTATLGLGLSGTLTTINSATQSLTIATSSLYTGTVGQVPYFSGSNALIGTSSIVIDTNTFVGVGSTSPKALFSIGAPAGIQSLFQVGSTSNVIGPLFNINNLGKTVVQDVINKWLGVVSPTKTLVLSAATTTATWTGTSTPGVDSSATTTAPYAGTIRQILCTANTFLGIQILIGTQVITPTYFVASSTVGTVGVTANNTFNKGDKISAYFGTTTTAVAGTPVSASCSILTTETP